jgi:hypothetical protein
MTGFASMAESYIAQGAVPVPCGGRDGKRPLVAWKNCGPDDARRKLSEWRTKFGPANIGLLTGVSGLVVVDLDDGRDALVREVEQRFGETPYVVRTPRGGFHFYYRSSGEPTKAHIDGKPIDIRGIGGFVVAPPSDTPDGRVYQNVRGSLENLSRLPALKPGVVVQFAPQAVIAAGVRNHTLWRRAMVVAHSVSSLLKLEAEMARINAVECDPPLDADEVRRLAASAWEYEERGSNWVGQGGARVYLTTEELEALTCDPDAMVLLLILRRAHRKRRGTFAISPRSMASEGHLKGWSERRIRNARVALLRRGFLLPVHAGGHGEGDPSRFQFPLRTPSTPTPSVYINIVEQIAPLEPAEI